MQPLPVEGAESTMAVSVPLPQEIPHQQTHRLDNELTIVNIAFSYVYNVTGM